MGCNRILREGGSRNGQQTRLECNNYVGRFIGDKRSSVCANSHYTTNEMIVKTSVNKEIITDITDIEDGGNKRI